MIIGRSIVRYCAGRRGVPSVAVILERPYRGLEMKRVGVLAALLSAFLALACVVPPEGAPGRDGAYPTQDEVQGEYHQLRRRAEIRLREQRLRVDRVGGRLIQTIPDHPQVQFVIDAGSRDINAGATFGQVGVTAGMLDFIRSDDEMAVVLGHELAHVTQGHVMQGMISGLGLDVLTIILESKAPGVGRAAGGVGQLFLNHFTQTQEREADAVGLRYVYEAGYDPRAAVDVMERMAVEVPQTMSAGYFDTHPSSVERAVVAKREAQELLAGGLPPHREDALALERRTSPAARSRGAPREHDEEFGELDERASSQREETERGAGRGDVSRSSFEPQPAASRSEECRRAETYLDRATDSEDLADKEELCRRALRYCPTLAEAHAQLGVVLRRRGDQSGAEQELRRALDLDPKNRSAREALRNATSR